MTFWYQHARQHKGKLLLLLPLSYLFRLVTIVRRLAYNRGWVASYRPPVPVAIVGNISVGGNGKTPVVLALVKAAQERGFKPGVVSRGYGGTAKNYPYNVTEFSAAAECGDEPLLIHLRTQCPVVVDPNRSQACKSIVEQGVDLIICDDGMQHYALQRDIEIAVIDSQRRLGNGFCLPAGPLREPASRLVDVDLIVSNGQPSYSTESHLLQLQPSALKAVKGSGDIQSDKHFDAAFAGIGNPERFFDSLEYLGFSVKQRINLEDHRPLSQEQHKELLDKSVIMTEKDAIKYRDSAGTNWYYLPVDSVLPEQFYQQFFSLLQEKSHVSRT
ncbi:MULTISPECIES: tetraacyldisaccharide 4'-kinase [unclassified Agarivorans]|uniref:tetraacyldisaccharide 4'-kinase n=1 Tax=unclassified Agarivorans TaxID=2636026 RepID=UPI0026E1DAA7|nr:MULTISPECIES: tetraacyldisaccharide 4'-kinase [unclassified Agarivorans]MDO6686396.1 tetraacyldisaccharide 4'-kinase [Agarivorans sp. 3_MG-2023]MDO6713698.1 tetraacyldisaccharide 4'-kinase [Agarivorans sp. 2_MG-2023]